MDYKRPDGRLPNELRDIIISFDGLDGVDGSARFGFGETKAVASVSGPIEVRLAAEQASKATFEVLVRPLAGLPGTDSKALASSLRSSLLPSLMLTNNPRTLVQLVAQSVTPMPISTTTQSQRIRSSPALVAALINAASLTLINASTIPLRGVVCGASVGRVRSTGGLVVDPAEDELVALDGAGTFAFLITGQDPSARGEIPLKASLVWSTWNATPFDEDELVRAIELARAGALRVREHMREAISQAVFGHVKIKEERMEAEPVPVDDAKMEIS